MLHLPYIIALLIAVLTSTVLGLLSYVLIFQRVQFIEERFLATITAALGLTLILGQTGLLVFGTLPRSIPSVFPGMIHLCGINISIDKLALMGLSIIVSVALFLFHGKTKIGRAMHAVSILPEVASLHGINANGIYLVTMGIGTALAGFAGGIIAPCYSINPHMGTNIIVSVLLLVMLGGMDSMLGAVAAGVIVGQILSFGQFFIGGSVQILLFIVIGVVIFLRPAGLLGSQEDFGGLDINV
jgi:branched-subunit amino acid ABC-type transport system permease component